MDWFANMTKWRRDLKNAPRDGTPIRVLLESTVVYEEHIPMLLMGGWKRREANDRIIGWKPCENRTAAEQAKRVAKLRVARKRKAE